MATVLTDNRGAGGISAQCGGAKGDKEALKKAFDERRRREARSRVSPLV